MWLYYNFGNMLISSPVTTEVGILYVGESSRHVTSGTS